MRIPKNENPLMDQYLGVLVQDGAVRVAVSRAGSRYLIQHRRPNTFWWQASWALDRETLLERLPAGFPRGPVLALPARPRDVVRPWADLQAEREAERKEAEEKAENHPAQVCIDEKAGVRLIAPQREGDNFRLQKRTKVRGWSDFAQAPSLRSLAGSVVAKGEPRGYGPRRVVSDPLAYTLQALIRLEALCGPLRPGEQPSPTRCQKNRAGRPAARLRAARAIRDLSERPGIAPKRPKRS